MSERSVGDDTSPDKLDEITSERLLCRRPVTVRRRVIWGECDPAQVAYTPRFADYLIAAFDWFCRSVLSGDLTDEQGDYLITPMKALSLEFHRVLRPGDLFDMTVYVSAVRIHTFDLLVSARSPQGQLHFEGRISPIIVNQENFKSVSIPPGARQALVNYQRECAQGEIPDG